MKLLTAYSATLEIIAGRLSAIALVIVCIEVYLRYFVPQMLPDWGHEVVIYLFAWAIMLMGGLLIKEDRHVRADLISEMFPKHVMKYFDLIVALLGIIFCCSLMYFGWQTVSFAITFEEVSDSSIQFPMYLFYLCLPVGMFFMTLHYIALIIQAIARILGKSPENHGEVSHA